jgi:hypothetical protein
MHVPRKAVTTRRSTAVYVTKSIDVMARRLDDCCTFANDLEKENLGACHGILHASGVRRLSDLRTMTSAHMDDMGVVEADRRNLVRVIDALENNSNDDGIQRSSTATTRAYAIDSKSRLSTIVDGGAFQISNSAQQLAYTPGSGVRVAQQQFGITVISEEHEIFIGRLFTVEQCLQISRMAEYHAYSTQNKHGNTAATTGWSNGVYTLTAQHLLCKDVPGLLSTTSPIFRQLLRELYTLFPGRIRQGTVVFENSGEPHLVKYNGATKGTQLHKDNAEYIYLTINVVLSSSDDFNGGGTYIKAIDETIHLKQGEMLIHLGNLEHAGVDITSGVRNLLIAFVACEWEEEALNKANPDERRTE